MRKYRWMILSAALLAALATGCRDWTQAEAPGLETQEEGTGKMIPETAAESSTVTAGTAKSSTVTAGAAESSTVTAGAAESSTVTAGAAKSSTVTIGAAESRRAMPLTDIRQQAAGEVLDADQIDSDEPRQYFTSDTIREGDAVYSRINGKSYRENDRISLSDLRYLKLLHYNYRHEIQVGELIANKKIAGDLLDIFEELYRKGYEIESMYLVDNYWPEPGTADAGVAADENSMMSNNTSCFNYRVVPGKKSLSNHALGCAIDINPYQNPYVIFDPNGKQVLEGGGDPSYINRSNKRAHMIDHEDPAYLLFIKHGFRWGGDWHSSRDYQHFEKKNE